MERDWSWVQTQIEFDEAMHESDLARAWSCAARMPRDKFSLDRALSLTLLAAEKHHPRFEEMAQHLVVKAIHDAEPPLIQIKKLADALAHLHHPHLGREAWRGLVRCAGRLSDNYEGVEVDFDSLAAIEEPEGRR